MFTMVHTHAVYIRFYTDNISKNEDGRLLTIGNQMV